MTEKNTEKRFAFLPLAALFFANPHVSAIDVLPDFVGVLLLFYIFAPFVHLSPYMQDMQKGLKKAAVYTFLRIGATALLIFLFIKYPSQTTLFPVFSLSFLILDCIFILPAFMHLCSALSSLDLEYAPFGKSFGSALSSFSRLLPFFFVMRGILPFLPDLLLLTDDAAGTSLVAYYPFALIFTLLPALIFTYLFFNALRALKPYLLQASDMLFQLVRPHEDLMAREHTVAQIRTGWLFVLLFAFFQVDLHLSAIDFAPDALAPLSILLAFFFFMKSGALSLQKLKRPFLCASILFLPSLASDIAYSLFFRTYDFRDIYYSAEAESRYIAVLCIFAVKIAVEIWLLYEIYRPLWHMAVEETGAYIENSPIRRQQEKNKRSLSRIVTVFCLTGVIGALLEFSDMVCALFPVVYPANRGHVSGGETVLPALDFLGTLLTALMLLRFLYMIFSYWRMIEETRAKYKLDDFE